jgi:hypothetical protein
LKKPTKFFWTAAKKADRMMDSKISDLNLTLIRGNSLWHIKKDKAPQETAETAMLNTEV